MAQARGGFFGKIFGALKNVFGPIVSGIGNAVSGIFGGAKKKATAVAHQAIGHAKNAAIQAIQTGDIRGAASSLQANLLTTKREIWQPCWRTMGFIEVLRSATDPRHEMPLWNGPVRLGVTDDGKRPLPIGVAFIELCSNLDTKYLPPGPVC